MLHAVVHAASVQDSDGAGLVLDRRTRRRFPFLKVVFADQGYQGPKAATAVARAGAWTLDIVHRVAGQKGFAVLPMRSVVEWNHSGSSPVSRRYFETFPRRAVSECAREIQ